MKKFALTLCLLPSLALADTVRLPDGNSCSFDSGTTPWRFKIESKKSDRDEEDLGTFRNRDFQRDEVSVGASLTYSFGGPKRLDCSRLYEMQLRTKEAELKQLEQKVKLLSQAEGLKWD